MKKSLLIFFSLILFGGIIIITLRSCNSNGKVSVICPEIVQFESDLGIINVGQKSLGKVLLVDTVSKHVFDIGQLHLPSSKISQSPVRDSIVMLSDTKFKTELSGSVTKASSALKASINSAIDNNTTFFLSNCVRKDLDNPISELNSEADSLPSKFKEPILNNPHTILAVVTSMAYADKFEFRLRKNSTVNAELNSLDLEGYNLSINYKCQDGLNIHGKQDGIFYKVTYYGLESNRFKLLAVVLKFNEFTTPENSLE